MASQIYQKRQDKSQTEQGKDRTKAKRKILMTKVNHKWKVTSVLVRVPTKVTHGQGSGEEMPREPQLLEIQIFCIRTKRSQYDLGMEKKRWTCSKRGMPEAINTQEKRKREKKVS